MAFLYRAASQGNDVRPQRGRCAWEATSAQCSVLEHYKSTNSAKTSMFSVELVLNFSRQLWLVGLLLCVEDFLSRCNNLCPKLDIFKFWRVCALGECSSKAALRAHEKNHSACRCRAILLRDSGLSQAPLEPQLTDSSSQRFPRTTHEHFQGPIPTQESHLERFTACFQLHQQRLEELGAKIRFRLTLNLQFI